jgi:hypothetical protein
VREHITAPIDPRFCRDSALIEADADVAKRALETVKATFLLERQQLESQVASFQAERVSGFVVSLSTNRHALP